MAAKMEVLLENWLEDDAANVSSRSNPTTLDGNVGEKNYEVENFFEGRTAEIALELAPGERNIAENHLTGSDGNCGSKGDNDLLGKGNEDLREKPTNVTNPKQRLLKLLCGGKPSLLRLLFKGNFRTCAAALAIRKNSKQKNTRSVAQHVRKMISDSKRTTEGTCSKKRKHRAQSYQPTTGNSKYDSYIGSTKISRQQEKENEFSRSSSNIQSRSRSFSLTRAIYTVHRKSSSATRTARYMNETLNTKQANNKVLSVILTGLFGGSYPNVAQLAFGAFCDCKQNRSIAQLLLESNNNDLSLAQILLLKYDELEPYSINEVGDIEPANINSNCLEDVEQNNEKVNPDRCLSALDITNIYEYINEANIVLNQNLAEEENSPMSFVEVLFHLPKDKNRQSLMKLLLLEEQHFGLDRSQVSIARLLLSKPEKGKSILEMLISKDTLTVSTNVFAVLLQGEIEDETSIIRMLFEKGLIRFLLKGEQNNKPSLLRLLIDEFSNDGKPSVFFNSKHVRSLFMNVASRKVYATLLKLVSALLSSNSKVEPLFKFFYKAVVDMLPLKDIIHTFGIDQNKVSVQKLAEIMKIKIHQLLEKQINEAGKVPVFLLITTGMFCGWRVRVKIDSTHTNSGNELNDENETLDKEVLWWQEQFLDRAFRLSQTEHEGSAWQILFHRCALAIQPEGKYGEKFKHIAKMIAKTKDEYGNKIDILDRFQMIFSALSLEEESLKFLENNKWLSFCVEIFTYWSNSGEEAKTTENTVSGLFHLGQTLLQFIGNDFDINSYRETELPKSEID